MGIIFYLYKMNPRSAFEGGCRWLYDLRVFCIVWGEEGGPCTWHMVFNGGVWLRKVV